MQKVGSEPLKEVSRYESEYTCEEIISTNYITILNTMDIYIYILNFVRTFRYIYIYLKVPVIRFLLTLKESRARNDKVLQF